LSNTPKAGTPAIVRVVARTNRTGRVVFSHRWHWEGQAAQHRGRINVPPRDPGEEPTPIHFHLKDDTRPARRLVFADDGPMWVRRSSCPEASQPCGDSQVPANKMERHNHLLKVVDNNSKECTLHYRLRFTDRAGRHVSYDPDIKNGGTNSL
jgi:hypothetical protein